MTRAPACVATDCRLQPAVTSRCDSARRSAKDPECGGIVTAGLVCVDRGHLLAGRVRISAHVIAVFRAEGELPDG